MPDPIEESSGHRLWSTNEVISSDGLNNVGRMAQRSLTDFLAAGMFQFERDGGAGEDADPGVMGDSFMVTAGAGDLDVIIAGGRGLAVDTAEASLYLSRYVPVALGGPVPLSHLVHEANPRMDAVIVTPAAVDDDNDDELIYDTGTATATPTAVNRRRYNLANVAIWPGIAAANPSPPAGLPANAIILAYVLVPATAGPLVIHDARNELQLVRSMAYGYGQGVTGKLLHQPWVPNSDTSNVLLVSETTPPSMAVLIQPGQAMARGRWSRHPLEVTLAITAADPVLNRTDAIVVDQGSNLIVKAGVAGGAAGVANADEVFLGSVFVGALVTQINPSDITDKRERAPYDGYAIRSGSIGEDAMAAPSIKPVVTESVQIPEGGFETINLDIQTSYPWGASAVVPGPPVDVEMQIFNDGGEPFPTDNTIIVSAGVANTGVLIVPTGAFPASSARAIITVDANGQCQFGVSVATASLPQNIQYIASIIGHPSHRVRGSVTIS